MRWMPVHLHGHELLERNANAGREQRQPAPERKIHAAVSRGGTKYPTSRRPPWRGPPPPGVKCHRRQSLPQLEGKKGHFNKARESKRPTGKLACAAQADPRLSLWSVLQIIREAETMGKLRGGRRVVAGTNADGLRAGTGSGMHGAGKKTRADRFQSREAECMRRVCWTWPSRPSDEQCHNVLPRNSTTGVRC
jgi:hypothetical protein